MATIRRATSADIEPIVEMCNRFLQYTEYRSVINPADGEIHNAMNFILENGAIFVADQAGVVVGFIACFISSAWFSASTKIAMEMAWWMNEDHRGGTAAIRLVRAYEDWAANEGATFICMSDLVVNGETPIARILPRMGYTMTERTHMKGTQR